MHSAGTGMRSPLVRSARIMAPAADRMPYVIHGSGSYTLSGKDAHVLATDIFPLINGIDTIDEIAATASQSGTITLDQAENVLRWLIEEGLCVVDLVEPGDEPLRRQYLSQLTYFARYCSHPTVCQKRLQASRVVVINLEGIGSKLVQLLAEAGVGYLRGVKNPRSQADEVIASRSHVEETSQHTFLERQVREVGYDAHYEGISVQLDEPLDWERLLADCDLAVLVDQGQPTHIQEFNRAALAREVPFILVRSDSDSAHVGPLVVAGETACLRCLESRLYRHRAYDTFCNIGQQLASATWAIASMTTAEIIKAITQYRPSVIRGHKLCINLQDWQSQLHTVLKDPHCPACSRRRNTPLVQPVYAMSREGVD